MLIGAGLIVLVMLFFMWNVRGALIASLTIPFSIAIALILMDLGGVDADRHVHRRAGHRHRQDGQRLHHHGGEHLPGAAGTGGDTTRRRGSPWQGAGEVGPYLVSANLLILLVFLPLMTLSGLEGAMFRPTAFAVAAALLGSMVLNLSLQPVLCACPFGVQRGPERQNPVNVFLMRWYRRLLVGGARPEVDRRPPARRSAPSRRPLPCRDSVASSSRRSTKAPSSPPR